MVKTRIAPSPTGKLHIGTARSALFNYLFARHEGGKFLLRIEDTDQARSTKEFENDIIDGLTWLGLSWDEEVYRQSERVDIHRKYLLKLLKEKKAYYCFHAQEEIDALHEKTPWARFLHIGLNREKDFFYEEANEKIRNTSNYVIRFKVDRGEPRKSGPAEVVDFEDLIRGYIVFPLDLIEDFSIAKNIDEPLYNFAVVVDDEDMGITHVIRGEDHISNTPKQILLQEALGFNTPQYAHLPLVLGPDKSKLSKRHGASSLSEFKDAGYLAEAMINMMAFLGWNPGDEREFFTLEELVKEFSLGRVKKGGAVFDIQRLNFLNQHYLRSLPLETITQRAKEFFLHEYGIETVESFKNLKEAVALERSRATTLVELVQSLDFIFHLPDYDSSLLSWKDQVKEDTVAKLHQALASIEALPKEEYDAAHLQERLFNEAQKAGDRGMLLWPLRVALSGKTSSPGPHEIAAVLGKEETLKRIRYATNRIND